MAKTSKAIEELLIRKGVIPTGDRLKDLELAKSVMPKPFKKEKKMNLADLIIENGKLKNEIDDLKNELQKVKNLNFEKGLGVVKFMRESENFLINK